MAINFSIIFLLVTVACNAEQEITNSPENDNQFSCENKESSDICLECSRLSLVIQVPLDKCCSDVNSFMFCDACLSDPVSCGKLASELEEVAEFENAEDYYDDGRNENDYYDDALQKLFASVSNADTGTGISRDKRYGRLFMNNRKRYGRLLFGKRDSTMGSELDKRYGRLYLGSGSYFGKRDSNDVEKRYGSLFMNKSRWFGKRSGDAEKRYGPLFIGKSRNGWFGKRDGENGEVGGENEADIAATKRYGSLFMGKRGSFGDEAEPIVADKRYGRLFMGRRRGGWLG